MPLLASAKSQESPEALCLWNATRRSRCGSFYRLHTPRWHRTRRPGAWAACENRPAPVSWAVHRPGRGAAQRDAAPPCRITPIWVTIEKRPVGARIQDTIGERIPGAPHALVSRRRTPLQPWGRQEKAVEARSSAGVRRTVLPFESFLRPANDLTRRRVATPASARGPGPPGPLR